MKIAILSDIHENFHNLICALKEIRSRDVEQIIFLGDFMNAGIAILLSEAPIPVLPFGETTMVINQQSVEKH